MADVTISIGQQEDIFLYDDTGTYSDASPVVGIKSARIQATLAPTVADDVVRLDDLGSLFAPHDASYVVVALDGTLTTERRLQAGAGLTLTDGGANADIDIDVVAVANGGLLINANNMQLDISSLAIDTIAAGDFLAFEDITGGLDNKITFANLEGTLNHDNLTGFVANEHIDWTGATGTNLNCSGAEIDGNLNHDGSNVGFYGTVPIAQQTGVAVTIAAVHAALVSLGLITA